VVTEFDNHRGRGGFTTDIAIIEARLKRNKVYLTYLTLMYDMMLVILSGAGVGPVYLR